ncbi:MAG: glutamate-1-semialdehyde 2,1-aminomutase [Deltaproteobacteria bacterium]|nr:glutamate-1-semialdehyde 2,1-aminomutase [Deltaproteobacteria bacterium]
MRTYLSEKLYAEACRVIPGGVNSPVRAFRAVGGTPRFIARARGSRIIDADGNEYVDYVCSWGPLILGHAHPEVVRGIHEAIRDGTSFGAPTAAEVELARMVVEAYSSIDLLRLVSSGTEAVMAALRVARAHTGRDKILKFEGCYHGHADSLLVKAGSGATTFGVPDSPGVPADFARHTLTVPYNDLAGVEAAVASEEGQIAAIVVEPVAGNMGVVPPAEGFLPGLRALADRAGIVLIFDEVITGFRVAFGGAQQRYGVRADLTCLGKILGGGLPLAAYGGRRDLMELVSPQGPVYQAGTLSGNPVAVRAGLETLRELRRPGVYEGLEEQGALLTGELETLARKFEIPTCTNRVGSMFTTFFTEGPVNDYATATRADTARFARYFQALLDNGIYIAPSQFEAGFLSTAHTQEDLALTLRGAEAAFRRLAGH